MTPKRWLCCPMSFIPPVLFAALVPYVSAVWLPGPNLFGVQHIAMKECTTKVLAKQTAVGRPGLRAKSRDFSFSLSRLGIAPRRVLGMGYGRPTSLLIVRNNL